MVREGMRGADHQQNHMFSYLSPEMRVRKNHPLRAIRAMVDEVLTQLSRRFDAMYARVGRPSIPPEKLHGVRPKKLTNTRNQPAQQSQMMRIRKTTVLPINFSAA